MKIHELKLVEQYAKAKKDGLKPFEIRNNDRKFEVGDLVKYKVVEQCMEHLPPHRTFTRESSNIGLVEYFDTTVFKITYITCYEQKDGYVVFTDKPYYIGD